jgi:hypothetical protein
MAPSSRNGAHEEFWQWMIENSTAKYWVLYGKKQESTYCGDIGPSLFPMNPSKFTIGLDRDPIDNRINIRFGCSREADTLDRYMSETT